MMRTVFAIAMIACSLAAPASDREFTSRKIVNPTAFYPEGPQLIDEGLLVAEMPKNRVVLVSDAGVKVVWAEDGCGPTSVKKIPGGGYWVLCHLGHHVVRLNANFQTERVFEQTMAGRRIMWPNDSSVDGEGNLYLSSSGVFSLQAPADGRVVFISVSGGQAYEMAGGIRYSNGVLVQESRGRVLVSEHLNRRILSFPLIGKGKLGTPSVFFDFKQAPAVSDAFDHSGPDGLAAFADGDIMVADYGNGRLLMLTEKGRFIKQLPLRYRFVTNMAITRDEKSLYVVMTQSNASPDLHGVVEEFAVTSGKKPL